MSSEWWDSYKSSDVAEKKEFERLPNGKYVATITKATVDTNAVPNVLQWEYTLVEGQFKNRKVWSNQRLTAEGMPFIKADMRALGFEEFGSANEFYEALGNCVGLVVDIFVKSKPAKTDPSKIYTNAYLNGLSKNEPEMIAGEGDLFGSTDEPPMFDSSEEISF